MDLRHQKQFCFEGILEGTFDFEAFREVNLLLRHLGRDEVRYDMLILIQLPFNGTCVPRGGANGSGGQVNP